MRGEVADLLPESRQTMPSNRKQTSACIYRVLLTLVCGWGLYLNIYGFTGRFDLQALVFYTILSNLACFLFFGLFSLAGLFGCQGIFLSGDGKAYGLVKGGLTVAIALTMAGFHYYYGPGLGNSASIFIPFRAFNAVPHYIVPLMVILDWLLFDKGWKIRVTAPLMWLVIPLAYFVFMLSRAQYGGVLRIVNSKYPYYFLDAGRIGWSAVLGNAALLAGIFLVAGYLFWLVNRIKLSVSQGK